MMYLNQNSLVSSFPVVLHPFVRLSEAAALIHNRECDVPMIKLVQDLAQKYQITFGRRIFAIN